MIQGSNPGKGQEIFSFLKYPDCLSGPPSLPASYSIGARALSLEVKQPALKANHSPQPGTQIMNEWSYASTPPMFLHVMYRYFILTFQ
jgi:hypothetical protein